MFRVSCIQLKSTNNIHQNLKKTEKLIKQNKKILFRKLIMSFLGFDPCTGSTIIQANSFE